MDNKKLAEELWEKYNKGECTARERMLVETWLLEFSEEDLSVPSHEVLSKADRNIRSKLPIDVQSPKSFPIQFWSLRIAAVAAAVVVAVSIVIYVNKRGEEVQLPAYSNDVNPGSNKATLTLGNGNKIDLSSSKTGVVIDVNKLTYSDGTLLSSPALRGDTPKQSLSMENLTLTTPLGGQYQVRLSDGSMIWMNAGSTLKFPSNFNNLKQRKVYLSGEAYFEVAKDTLHPFIIHSEKQEVQVVGTHFNVYSYPDEPIVKTTLLEGSVIITNTLYSHPPGMRHPGKNQDGVKLEPGQQAVLSKESLLVHKVDTENSVAWKNDQFIFIDEPLGSIMKKLARWYNIQVTFENKEMEKKLFGGIASRKMKISEILNMLQITGEVHFKIEGRTVMVN